MKVIKNMSGDVSLNAELVSKIHLVTDGHGVSVYADNEKLYEAPDKIGAQKYYDELIRFVSTGSNIGVFTFDPD